MNNSPSQRLDDEIIGAVPPAPLPPHLWQAPNYRAAGYIKTGLFLGGLAGCTSLLINVIGSVAWPAISGNPQHPLRLIQVYLTFPFGEPALQFNSGVLLALGCLLYLATGMLYGMLFEWSISYFIPAAGLIARIIFCSVLAIIVWAVNFYVILIWLQPLLFGGRWVIDLLPWWVAALTHLVYGATMAGIYPLGERYGGELQAPT